MAQYILILGVRFYRWVISPAKVFLFGPLGGCRFTPTCSAYALEALQRHGALAGTCLAARRVCRCHPWGGCGYDPVPRGQSSSRDSSANNLPPTQAPSKLQGIRGSTPASIGIP